MYHTYVLQSLKNGRLHTGSTNNLDRRIIEHNSGLSKYTKLTRPFKLLYYETFETRVEAVKREKYLKTGKGRDELSKLIEK